MPRDNVVESGNPLHQDQNDQECLTHEKVKDDKNRTKEIELEDTMSIKPSAITFKFDELAQWKMSFKVATK